MPSLSLPLFERVSNSFTQLSTVAADLNAVSDELGKSVSQIDEALKKLNLGITVWVRIRAWDYDWPGENHYKAEDLGYAKVNGKWGISLRIQEGDYGDLDDVDDEVWLFSDAPRALRLTAIDKLPELLDNLSKEAVIAAAQVKAKLANVQDVAAAMSTKPAKGQPSKQKDVGPAEVAMREVLLAHDALTADVMQAARKALGGAK